MYTPEAAVAVGLITLGTVVAVVLFLIARAVGRAWSRRGPASKSAHHFDPVEALEMTAGAIGLTVLLLGMLIFSIQGPLHLAGALAVLLAIAYALAWFREFRFLMQLPDEAFPGRFDKPIWALLLIVLPPVGVLSFRSFRRAHWPEVKSADALMLHELG
jgi:hypothetical protein